MTTIALSTTEAEYVALSTSMRDVIYFMNLIDVVVDVKLVENRNCEKSSEKAMTTKLERLYSSKEGTAVTAATLRRI